MNSNSSNYFTKSINFILLLLLSLPTEVSYAQSFSTLIDSPLGETGNISEFINEFYILLIVAAATFAVIKIVIAGVKYMLTDIVTSKEDAKKDIRTSLLGLIIIVAAVLLLGTINPSLVDFDLQFQKPTETLTVARGNANTAQATETKLNDLGSSIKQNHPCVEVGETTNSSDGLTQSSSIDVSACPDNEAGIAFIEQCGDTDPPGRSQSSPDTPEVVTCTVPIPGAIAGQAAAEDVSGATTNFGQAIGAEFVTQEGNTITTNITAACSAQAANGSFITEASRSNLFDQCVRDTNSRIRGECEGTTWGFYGNYGIYNGSNNEAVTCRVPVSRSSINQLTAQFEAWKNAAPAERQFKTLDSLSASEERDICEGANNGSTINAIYYDEWGTNNTCAFYATPTG